MKILRKITLVLFVITLCAFVFVVFYDRKNTDNTFPIITIPEGQLEVSINYERSELLEGISAYDEKDGDITDTLIIESISQFIGEGVYTVTYAASDSDCHVAKATRTIRFTDYTPPRFYLTRPLVFAVGEKVDFRNIVGATDCLDGNISDKISFIGTDYTSTSEGVYTLSVQVNSSRGDIMYLDLPVYVEQTLALAPKIVLSEALVYTKVGEELDPKSYVAAVTSGGKLAEDYELEISTDLDISTPGMYSVHYYATDKDGHIGHMILTVIVED